MLLPVDVGKLIRKSFEEEMLGVATSLNLSCETVEHPHLLGTQVAFNVSGPLDDVRAFEATLRTSARATMRLDPGLIPFGAP